MSKNIFGKPLPGQSRKAKPCPFCGNPPERMTINGMRIVCCIPCTSTIGPNGQRTVADWNQQVDGINAELQKQKSAAREAGREVHDINPKD